MVSLIPNPDREEAVTVNGSFSDWSTVCSGITQGTVLGPVLLITSVNYLPGCIGSKWKLFADDMKVYIRAGTEFSPPAAGFGCPGSLVFQMEADIQPIQVHSALLGSQNVQSTQSRVLHLRVKTVDMERDLGVQVDDLLQSREQAATAIGKANIGNHWSD